MSKWLSSDTRGVQWVFFLLYNSRWQCHYIGNRLVSSASSPKFAFLIGEIRPVFSKIRPTFHNGPYDLLLALLKFGGIDLSMPISILFNLYQMMAVFATSWRVPSRTQFTKRLKAENISLQARQPHPSCLTYYGENHKTWVANLPIRTWPHQRRPIQFASKEILFHLHGWFLKHSNGSSRRWKSVALVFLDMTKA